MTSVSRSQRRVIVTADDLGLREEWDHAILGCVERGVVTSVAVATSGPSFPAACRSLLACGVDHGIHLTLLGTGPLSPASEVPSLLSSEGRFPDTLALLMKRWVGSPPRRAQVSREWARQLERALDHGLRPTHLSGHYYLHLLPGLARVVAELAARFRIPWVRVVREAPPWGVPAAVRLRAYALRLASATARPMIERAGVGVMDCRGAWAGGRLDLRAWAAVLERLPAGIAEVVCHPGQGEAETRALTDPELRRRIEERARLCSFRGLAVNDVG